MSESIQFQSFAAHYPNVQLGPEFADALFVEMRPDVTHITEVDVKGCDLADVLIVTASKVYFAITAESVLAEAATATRNRSGAVQATFSQNANFQDCATISDSSGEWIKIDLPVGIGGYIAKQTEEKNPWAPSGGCCNTILLIAALAVVALGTTYKLGLFPCNATSKV